MVTGSQNVTDKKISSAFIYFFGSFGGILFGYDIGVMTGALPFCKTTGDCKVMPARLAGLPQLLCLVLFLAERLLDSFQTVWAAAR